MVVIKKLEKGEQSMNVMEYNTPVAANVAEIISARGLKKSPIAKRIGVTDQQFSDMLNGRRVIKACDIPRLADALGVEPNDLFGGAQEERR